MEYDVVSKTISNLPIILVLCVCLLSFFLTAKLKNDFQFHNKEERINQLEYDLEGTRADLESKLRQISDLEDSLNDVQTELAQTKDQKASAINEVKHFFFSLSSAFLICYI